MFLKNCQPTFRIFILLCLSALHCETSLSQIKILFDATKAESASNADWVIDADQHNLDWNPGARICSSSSCHNSNAQRIPTPPQPIAGLLTAENFWDGALSFWALDCAYKGYIVESLPAISGKITYGDNSNLQDLSYYNIFAVCEPNIKFTDAEKTALLDFVRNGGGLFIISDHNVSDRNNDGFDSPNIWNDLFQTNSTGNTNPFGIIFDLANFSETSVNISTNTNADTLLRPGGTGWGNVTRVKWSGGTSITLNPAANASVVPIVYKTGGSGNSNVLVAIARYGAGKVVAVGDSSPFDDGTGDPHDNLFTGYNGDVTPNHRNLIMNATIWLAAKNNSVYTFTGDGNWNVVSNWLNNKIPPSTLPAGDEIFINPIANGNCKLNIIQHISIGAKMTVAAGKNLLIPETLVIQ